MRVGDGPTVDELEYIAAIESLKEKAHNHRQQAAVLDVLIDELEDKFYGA